MSGLIGSLTTVEWALLALNTLLLVFAKPILSRITSTADERSSAWRLNAFRGLNVLMLLTVGTGAALGPNAGERGVLLKLLLVLATVWCFYLAMQLAGYGLRQRYGVRRTVDGQEVLSDSWTSRLLYLLACGFLSVLGLVTAIQIAGFNSLLQTTGVLGFLGVFLALTQSSWLPDIAAGLILLDGRMLEEGDIVLVPFGQQRTTCAVHKTKLFHTELLDLADNHRIMVSNAWLRGQPLHNLSKFASAKGLREALHFKIGYEVTADTVRALMASAAERAAADGVAFESQHPIEVVLQDTGDHALEWMVCYYTKAVRKRLLIRQQMREHILNEAQSRGVSLATPFGVSLDGSVLPAGTGATP
ncbi:MAG: mechanosensitive ion channel family protein [Pseudomonadota bacterium]